MFAKIFSGKGAATALLLLSSLCSPCAYGQGHGRGAGHGHGNGAGGGRPDLVGLERATPGIPTSPRGRGRNYNPGTPRGPINRSGFFRRTHHNNRNLLPGTPRRRRVRRHYHSH